jgi:hypothetical protein
LQTIAAYVRALRRDADLQAGHGVVGAGRNSLNLRFHKIFNPNREAARQWTSRRRNLLTPGGV